MSKKLIVIGGGPEGYVVAIRAAWLGAETVNKGYLEKHYLKGNMHKCANIEIDTHCTNKNSGFSYIDVEGY